MEGGSRLDRGDWVHGYKGKAMHPRSGGQAPWSRMPPASQRGEKIIRKKKLAIPGATKALVGLHKRKGSGIKKKPSALMRKTLKKRAKQQEMDMR